MLIIGISLLSGVEVISTHSGSVEQEASSITNRNAGFEEGLTGWVTYIDPGIASGARIAVVQDENAKYGKKCLFMRLPSIARDNQSQYISIGQNLQLDKSRRYKFSVQVKWDNPDNTLESAIISIWAKSADGIYVGKDVWINDGDDYKSLSFVFEPESDGETLCYLSLLPHQEGYDDTDIHVDEFRIEEIGSAIVERDPRPLT